MMIQAQGSYESAELLFRISKPRAAGCEGKMMPDGSHEDSVLATGLNVICCQLGGALFAQGLHDEAEGEFRLALMIDPHGEGGKLSLQQRKLFFLY